ncbi:MAG: outer membrane beta-barrel protein [Candidatus Delongbacteria bacterium]
MKRSIIGLSVLCLMAGMAHAEGMNLGFQLGQKGLSTDDWEMGSLDISSQLLYGLHFDKDMGWPVNLAADLLMSSGSDGDLKGSTMEIGVGVRKFFEMEKIKPYVGAGLAFISGKVEINSFDDNAGALGFFANGGAQYPINEKFNVGLDLRYSSATADFSGTDVAVGGFTFSLVLGMGL